MDVSATVDNELIRIVNLNGDGSNMVLVYVDNANDLKVKRFVFSNSTSGVATVGTGATVN